MSMYPRFWGFRGFDGVRGFDGNAQMAINVLWGILAAALVIVLMVSVVFLVFRGLGLARMAKRKNIPHGWMGFVPVLNLYLLGKISNMPDKRRRSDVVMLVLGILAFVSTAIFLAYFCPLVELALRASINPRLASNMTESVFSLLWGMMATTFICTGFSIARDVIKFIALNRIYKQFSPDNSTLMTVFTVLSAELFGIPIAPFLLFAIRNNEIWPMGKPPEGYEGQPQEPARVAEDVQDAQQDVSENSCAADDNE